jgi:predicted aspartyl protease
MPDESATSSLTRSLKVFFAYSHKDEALRDELEKHLALLNRSGVIASWHDRRISGGTEWDGEIDEYLNRADIILLLVSADFLASSYCYDREMKRAVERHDSGEARVVPIALRHCDWQGAPFAKLQGLPRDMKPVTSWSDRDEAFKDIAVGIRKVAEELSRTTPRIPTVREALLESAASRLHTKPGSGESLSSSGLHPLKWRPTPRRLALEGPVIDILISAPLPEMEAGRAIGLDFKQLQIKALIDTGAALTVINPQVASTCKLPQTDWSRIATVGGGGGVYPGYAAAISFPGTHLPNLKVVRVVASHIMGQPFFSCLIGRDILRNWLLVYDGPNGELEIRSR